MRSGSFMLCQSGDSFWALWCACSEIDRGAASGAWVGASFSGGDDASDCHGSLNFLSAGFSEGSGAERFIPFFPWEDFAGSGAMIADAARGKESVDKVETGRVGNEKRK